jgi:hypothetical protein
MTSILSFCHLVIPQEQPFSHQERKEEMSRKLVVVVLPVLMAAAVLAVLFGGPVWANITAEGDVPTVMTYQGFLQNSSGEPISGTVNLVFSIYDQESGGNKVWEESHSSVPVADGIFTVLLGSAGTPLTPEVFSSESRYIQVTVDGGSPLPRQRIASVPYALRAQEAKSAESADTATTAQSADTANTAESASTAITATYAYSLVNGLSPSDGFAYVVVVAKSGGDYTTVTDALNSISPSSDNRYLILVMPGVYTEQVRVPEYVHIRGAGPHLTRITSQTESNNINNPDAATLVLPANSQLSELSVANTGAAQDSSAIYVDGGNESTELTNVHVLANSNGGDRHVGIYFSGGTAKLTHVYADAAGATIFNRAVNTNGASPVIESSTLLANGGSGAAGLYVNGGDPSITNSTLNGDNAAAAYGIETNGNSSVRIDHAIIIGEDFGVRLSQSGDEAYIGASRLEGGANAEVGATFRCGQSYKEDAVELNANCL